MKIRARKRPFRRKSVQYPAPQRFSSKSSLFFTLEKFLHVIFMYMFSFGFVCMGFITFDSLCSSKYHHFGFSCRSTYLFLGKEILSQLQQEKRYSCRMIYVQQDQLKVREGSGDGEVFRNLRGEEKAWGRRPIRKTLKDCQTVFESLEFWDHDFKEKWSTHCNIFLWDDLLIYDMFRLNHEGPWTSCQGIWNIYCNR